jgi:hypothetical protein
LRLSPRPIITATHLTGFALTWVALLGGCAADPQVQSQSTIVVDPLETAVQAAQSTRSFRISFHYSDYYSLTAPNDLGCAGDARYLYKTLDLTNGRPSRLADSASGPSETIRPSFIKNVSVDLTDANANVTQNNAFACSVGNGATAPPVSACATFDYGAIGGIPTTLGGSLMLIGGQLAASNSFPTASCGPQFAGASPNSCGAGVYTLSIDSLPASIFETNPELVPGLSATPAGPVSSWANLSGVANYVGPRNGAGAVAAFDAGVQKVLLFGGSMAISPMSALDSTSAAVTTYDTWVYQLQSQSWTNPAATASVVASIKTLYETALDIRSGGTGPAGVVRPPCFFGSTAEECLTNGNESAPSPVTLSRMNGARALFGYLAVPGSGQNLDAITTNGVMAAGAIDRTDRLFTVGGYGSGILADTRRFNPTYGPEIRDWADGLTGINTGSATDNGLDTPAINTAYQWINSYPSQLMSSTYGSRFEPYTVSLPMPHPQLLYSNFSSLIRPDVPPLGSGQTGGDPVFNAAYATVVSQVGATLPGTGYPVAAGGFTLAAAANTVVDAATPADQAGCTKDGLAADAIAIPAMSNRTLECGGSLSIQTRWSETQTSGWGALTDLTDTNYTPLKPAIWKQLPETTNLMATPKATVPWVGGAHLLPGFNLATNDLVYFGGFDCRNYVSDSTAPCSYLSNPGRYWSLGANPAAIPDLSDAAVTATAFAGTLPSRAGMATARGLDPAGNVIILAWGGANGAGTTEGITKLYYLYRNGGVPTWSSPPLLPTAGTEPVVSAAGTTLPPDLINSQMVFSHTTHKFYVFGGVTSGGVTTSKTWELAVTSVGTAGTECNPSALHYCRFTWNELAPTCYPDCPQARRSHRMAEVNYDNRNPGGSVGGVTSGEQTCDSTTPCSYGIFMEGGSSDGLTYLGDRWMFDPTANGGKGHWQRMDEMPPRTLAAMTSVDYAIQGTGAAAHRAVMFGGETGLHSPASTYQYNWTTKTGGYVAPTLGDTWVYDYDNSSWNRVQLLGRGYNGVANLPAAPEFERRQAYDLTVATPQFTAAGDLGARANVMSPPALSGAIMVTRTMGPTAGAPTRLRLLKVPEVYLIGGRQKNGTFHTLDNVYKFCLGSTGEAFSTNAMDNLSYPSTTDFTCDAYDATNNPDSSSPQAGYVGRWLYKRPDVSTLTAAFTGSFMGAGAYDTARDRIIVVGGLSADATNGGDATTAVTRHTATAGGPVTATTRIYEYTPPQAGVAATPHEGRWSEVPQCVGSGSPVARYGHSMAYDPLNQGLVMTGGYTLSGTPLRQDLSTGSSSITTSAIPEVWRGTYYAAPVTAALNNQNPGVTITGTTPCYYWKQVTVFGNSTAIPSQSPPSTGLSHAASIYVPSTGYKSGYYTMLDNACEKAGPIATTDASVNKLLAGGAYIDIDRAQLGADENLLMSLTFLPLGTENLKPDATAFSTSESAIFRVHLIRVGQATDLLRSITQPRHLAYADTQTQFPIVVQSLSVLAPPTGQVTQEQLLLPISADPTIDRIRIERLSGSGILLDAALYRLGPPK